MSEQGGRLVIGAHNIHYLLNKRDLIYDPKWEYNLEATCL